MTPFTSPSDITAARTARYAQIYLNIADTCFQFFFSSAPSAPPFLYRLNAPYAGSFLKQLIAEQVRIAIGIVRSMFRHLVCVCVSREVRDFFTSAGFHTQITSAHSPGRLCVTFISQQLMRRIGLYIRWTVPQQHLHTRTTFQRYRRTHCPVANEYLLYSLLPRVQRFYSTCSIQLECRMTEGYETSYMRYTRAQTPYVRIIKVHNVSPLVHDFISKIIEG